MAETTRGIARLPSLDVELVHDRSENGDAERIAIRVTGRPDLHTAAQFVEPELMAAALATNPMLAWPMQVMQAMWTPWLAMNPWLRPALPPTKERLRLKS